MSVYTKEIPEGVRFETEEEAIHYFKTTLTTQTPLGGLYDDLHDEDWGNYLFQATGDDDKQIEVRMDNPDVDSNFYKYISLNTMGNELPLKKEDLIDSLKLHIKTVELASIIFLDEIPKIKRSLEAGEDKYFNPLTDFENITTRIGIESDLQGTRVVVALTDRATEQQVFTFVDLEGNKYLQTEDLEKALEALFLRKVEGEFDAYRFRAGGHNMSHILDYAAQNKKAVKLELL